MFVDLAEVDFNRLKYRECWLLWFNVFSILFTKCNFASNSSIVDIGKHLNFEGPFLASELILIAM